MHACDSAVQRAMRERVSAEDTALGLESLWHDVRDALRVFVKSPAFSFVVVVTLALGIGANTAIFQLLDAVQLRALPIAKPGELAQLRIVGGNSRIRSHRQCLLRFHRAHVAAGEGAP